jgi:hypothetical protein
VNTTLARKKLHGKLHEAGGSAIAQHLTLRKYIRCLFELSLLTNLGIDCPTGRQPISVAHACLIGRPLARSVYYES